MANPSNPEEYTVTDYSAVDNQINQMSMREMEITRRIRYQNHFRWVKIAAVFLVALGIFLLLLGFAVKQARSYKTETIHHTIIEDNSEEKPANEPPVQNIEETPTSDTPAQNIEAKPATAPPVQNIEETPTSDTPAQNIEAKPANEPPVKKIEAKPENAPPAQNIEDKRIAALEAEIADSGNKVIVKKDITSFVKEKTERKDYFEVITGVDYENSSDIKSTSRYCYALKSQPNNGGTLHINLGKQTQNEPAQKHKKPNVAGLTDNLFNSLYRKCQWGANAESSPQ